jgi:hypothetical protein
MIRVLKFARIGFSFLAALSAVSIFGNEAVMKIPANFKSLQNTLSMNAGFPQIASMSVDSVDMIFRKIIKTSPSVSQIFRLNSNGIVINEVDLKNSEYVSRNVSGQKWFDLLKTTQQPYFGTTRDSSRTTFLFWVWPTQTASLQFAGAIAVKIDPKVLVTSIDGIDSIPLKITYKEKTVYSNRWRDELQYEQIKWDLADGSHLVCFFESVSPGNEPLKIISESKIETPENYLSKDTVHEMPAIAKKKKSVMSVILFLIAVLIVISVITYYKVKRKQNEVLRDKSEVNESETAKPEIMHTQQIVEKSEIMDLVDVDSEEETCALETNKESETEVILKVKGKDIKKEIDIESMTDSAKKSYDKITGALFDGSVSGLGASDTFSEEQAGDDSSVMRHELYREVHGQIVQWVITEADRLSSVLDILTARIDSLEKDTGPQVEDIQKDALRISKEIELFRSQLPDPENSKL